MIFRRSLSREMNITAAGVFVVLLAILVTTQTINLLGRAAEGRIASDAVATLIGFWTLGLVPLLLILTVFISVLTVLTRHWREHEMAVWVGSGLALRQWLRPVLGFAIPFALIAALMTLVVDPWAVQRGKEYAEKLKQREDMAAVAPGLFKEAKGANRVYFVEDFSMVNGNARRVFVHDRSEEPEVTILANEGRLTTNEHGERVMILDKGFRYRGTPGEAGYEVGRFDKFEVIIGESLPVLGPITAIQAKDTAALFGGKDPRDTSELIWRISLPLCVLLLAIAAIPLSYFNPRSGHTYNLVFALLTFLAYQNTLTLVRKAIASGALHWSSMLLVHALLLGLALLLIRLREQPAAPLRNLLTKKR